MSEYWYIDSDNFVKLVGVQNRSANVYVNTGTFTGQMKTINNTTVGAVVTFAHVAESDGDWVVTIPKAITTTLTAGTFYRLDVTELASPNEVNIRLKRKASYHGK